MGHAPRNSRTEPGPTTNHPPTASKPTTTNTPSPTSGPTADSAPAPTRPAGAERILEAAIELFGNQGVAATSLKAIATRAEVSPPLIIHHYGSKAALRIACDVHVATLLREAKSDALGQGTHLSPLMAMAGIDDFRPAMRYLARTLTDGSPHTNALVDDLFSDALDYTADGVRNGLLRPSADPDARVAVLLIMSMGALVLHEHLERLIGESLIAGGQPPTRYVRTVVELFTNGVLSPDAYEELRDFVSEPSPPNGSTS